MRKTFYLILFLIFILSSCSSKVIENSLSAKEFLFETNYSLIVDGMELTKYDGEKLIRLNNGIVVELLNEQGNVISELLLTKHNVWYKFKNTDVNVLLLNSFL